jgi:hypothetical protein
MHIFNYYYKYVEPNETQEGQAQEFASESTNTDCLWDHRKVTQNS